ncbi:Hypothetical_protein [Hexamita inflata]|uniref:Hypothetical_protein n=1 Tax=Hexamita inflata TaxID=28002 RepID=A0AA86THG6_9EUKA|nr:Hypothetical protein HINF_LOCUS5355 [Hexamita inflata]
MGLCQQLYIPLTQLSFILAWSTFQAHVFAGNILNVGEPASYPVIDGNIHLILQLLGLLLFALTICQQLYCYQDTKFINSSYFIMLIYYLQNLNINKVISGSIFLRQIYL